MDNNNQLQTTGNNQLAVTYPLLQHSQKLIECLIKLEANDEGLRGDAKMELLSIASDLMPHGKPEFKSIIAYPKIDDLVKTQGRKNMLKAIFLLVKSFCNSINVVRNMNEDQMIECAQMLIDECDNFRLEDYVMMFQLAKRGQLVKIMDRIDIQVVTSMLDEYWKTRHKAGEQMQEKEVSHLETLGNTAKSIESLHPMDAKAIRAQEKLAGALDNLRSNVTSWIGNKEDMQQLKNVEKQDSEAVKLRNKDFDANNGKA